MSADFSVRSKSITALPLQIRIQKQINVLNVAVNMFKVNNYDTRSKSIDIIQVSLFLALKTHRTFNLVVLVLTLNMQWPAGYLIEDQCLGKVA